MKILKTKKITILTSLITLLLTTTLSFASGIENVGENAGQWFLDQVWWLALAVIAYFAVKYLIKKAWIQFLIFLVIGGIVLFIITSPESLKAIGEKLFQIITGN